MDTERLLVGGFLICFSLIHQVFSSLEDATSEVGLGANFDGVLAAFGDFNSDKKADLFLISSKTKDHSKVEIYLWDTGDDEFKKTTKATIRLEKSRISNIIPADFNGDGHLDVLVAFNNQSVSKTDTFIKVFFGLKNQFESEHVNMQDVLKDQPAIIDFDGDLLPDLLGEKKSDSKRYWWKYRPKTKKFESHVINSTGNLLPLTKPHSSAFLDLNGDYTPDIFIPTSNKKSSLITFEIWTNQEGKFNSPTTTVYPAKNEGKEQTIGQSTFADIDSDGIADHLLPVCIGKKCEKSEIQVYSKDKEKGWISVLMSEKSEGFKWRFVHDPEQETPFMTIRIGDYDLDGFPDAVVIVELQLDGEQEYKRRVVLLENVGCSGSSMGCYHGRKLNIVSGNHVLSSINNPLVVGFFDLYDNGILDLMVVTSNESSGTYQIRAIKNKVYSDTCFLKVIVLGGSCFSSCPSGVTPYGVNQAGPFVKYVTTGPDGDTKKASATQLSQAAYFALQPPYTVFGLGRTPNFVEKLIIGLPRSTNSSGRKHTWTSIIPNSQVIIIPYPRDEPDEWKSKLLVTPSRLVMLTGGALLATCVFIGAIIGLLHWKEKKEDLKEKQEAAHKFHFDAM